MYFFGHIYYFDLYFEDFDVFFNLGEVEEDLEDLGDELYCK
jgi:hypothetical protein